MGMIVGIWGKEYNSLEALLMIMKVLEYIGDTLWEVL